MQELNKHQPVTSGLLKYGKVLSDESKSVD